MPYTNWANPGYTFGDHEEQHTYQDELLGPLYLQSYLLGATGALLQGQNPVGPANFMEAGPYSAPPVPFK